MIEALHTIGDAGHLVGSWAVATASEPGQVEVTIEVTMWSRGHYRTEAQALVAGSLIVRHFEEAMQLLAGVPEIAPEADEAHGWWRSQVTLTLPKRATGRLVPQARRQPISALHTHRR